MTNVDRFIKKKSEQELDIRVKFFYRWFLLSNLLSEDTGENYSVLNHLQMFLNGKKRTVLISK